MSNLSRGIKKWPSRIDCRSPMPRRAQKLESGGAAAGMCARRSQWWASNTKRFGGAHQHGEHHCDAADLP